MTSLKDKNQVVVAPGIAIRKRREGLGLKAAELARRASMNPRTLDAIEKGRIQSPSIGNLSSLASVLNISVASLFCDSSHESDKIFISGNQKGQHTLEFPKDGFRLVSYTPLAPDFFVGKVILKGETRIERKVLPTSGMVFAQPIIGRLEVVFDGAEHTIKEGNYVFFDGNFKHSYYNPQYKECAFLLITTPSFLVPRKP